MLFTRINGVSLSLERKLTAERRMERAVRICLWILVTSLASLVGCMGWLAYRICWLVTHGPF